MPIIRKFAYLDDNGKIPSDQLSDHTHEDILNQINNIKNGITLDKHTDGLVYIFVNGLPVGNGIELGTGTIVEGDVIGYIDENNNILLSGALANGTYKFKYETEEGEFVEVGTLEVGVNEPTEPDNNILTSGDYDIKLNTRWSNSSGGFTGHSGMIAFTVPLEDVWGKTIRFKGFTPNITATSNSAPLWMTIDSNNSKVDLLAGTNDATGKIWASTFLQSNDDGEYSIVIDSSTFPTSGNGTAVKLAINMAVSATDSVTSLNGLSMTIEETIDKDEDEPVEVVNLIPTLTDIDLVTIYNSKGYKEDTRVSISSITASNPTGEKSQAGTTLTGLTPLGNNGDVFHFRNAKVKDTTASQYSGLIWYYDSSGAALNTGTIAIPDNLISTDENGDAIVIMNHSNLSIISGATYIRFNIVNPTGELIMTRNQLIPVN